MFPQFVLFYRTFFVTNKKNCFRNPFFRKQKYVYMYIYIYIYIYTLLFFFYNPLNITNDFFIYKNIFNFKSRLITFYYINLIIV